MARAAKKPAKTAAKKSAPKSAAPLLRQLALTLPETAEAPHFEATSFRVRGKIFATAGEGRSPQEGVLKLAPEIQQAMMQAHPDAFRPASGAWGRSGWTHVRVHAIPRALLNDLVVSAWGLVAPKKLAAAFRAEQA
ncbi:MAG: MmcQ/YjbR family DNA-binding protein [Hyphomonadaceae bacterium]